MKYPKIASALGWTESHDMAEGIYLQPEEAAKIERELSTRAAGISPNEIATRDKRIKDLEAQVASLSKGSVTGQSEASKAVKAGLLNNPDHEANQLADLATGKRAIIPKTHSLSSSEHPANKMADIATGAQKLGRES